MIAKCSIKIPRNHQPLAGTVAVMDQVMVLVESIPVLTEHSSSKIVDVFLKVDVLIKKGQSIGGVGQSMAELSQFLVSVHLLGLFGICAMIRLFTAPFPLVGVAGPGSSFIQSSAFEVSMPQEFFVGLFDFNI